MSLSTIGNHSLSSLLLYGSYGLYNVMKFRPTMFGSNDDSNLPTGYDLTYPPFMAGTSFTLAIASTPIRIIHSVTTMALCLPHILFSSKKDVDDDNMIVTTYYHFGACAAYITSQLYFNFSSSKKETITTKTKEEEEEEEKTGTNDGNATIPTSSSSTGIPFGARMISGLLGISQIGVSILFTSNYWNGNPKLYEPFLIETLSTTDKVPLDVLTPEFLKGVYYAGIHSVVGIGWSLGLNLTKSVVVDNNQQDCYDTLKCFVTNLSTQVVLHSICYLTGGGGHNDLHQYMFVHGPMSVPVLAMSFGGMYLCQRPTTRNDSKNDDDGNNDITTTTSLKKSN